MSDRDSITLAYLTRKLDLHERELAIREREADIEAARLELDREKFEYACNAMDDSNRRVIELLEHAATDMDDSLPVSRNRGRA